MNDENWASRITLTSRGVGLKLRGLMPPSDHEYLRLGLVEGYRATGLLWGDGVRLASAVERRGDRRKGILWNHVRLECGVVWNGLQVCYATAAHAAFDPEIWFGFGPWSRSRPQFLGGDMCERCCNAHTELSTTHTTLPATPRNTAVMHVMPITHADEATRHHSHATRGQSKYIG